MKNILIALSLLLQPNLNKDDFEKSYYDSMVYNGATRGVELAFESSLIIESMSAKTGGVSLGSGNLMKIGKHEVIFTAYHVVEDSIFAMAVEKNGNAIPVSLIYADPYKDFAVLVLDGPAIVTTAAKFRMRYDNGIGKPVCHVGHPSVIRFNLSRGIITALDGDYIVTDSFSLPGSSGSVVFGERGDVIGIVVAIGQDLQFDTPELVEEVVRVVPINYLDVQAIVEAIENETTRSKSGNSNN
jgi:S1-C subfamily serine protease|tara:strand:- start:714 stop:1439 length:726 start_codon:yes stop_codon:yes gene_type:complete